VERQSQVQFCQPGRDGWFKHERLIIANNGIYGYKYLMKALVVGLVLACLSFSPSVRADSPDDQYVNIYALIEQGDTLSDKGNSDAARAKYIDALKQLKQLQADNPHWNTQTVKYRMDYLTAKLAAAPGPSADTTPPPGINPGDPVEFKIKWPVGQRYVERVDASQAVDLTIPGAPKPMKNETTASQSAAVKVVKETDGGGRELELEMQDIRIVSKMGGQVLMSFDSKKDASGDNANPMTATLKKVVGMRVKILVDGAGKITAVEGTNGVQDAAVKDPSSPDAGKLINGALSESSIKQLVDDGKELPPGPVKIGDKWTTSHENDFGQLGKMVIKMELKFKGWEKHGGRKCAVFESTGTMSSAGDGNDAGPMSLKVEDGKLTGTTWFDPALGATVETAGSIAATAEVSAQGQKIAGKLNITVSRKLVEVTNAK
jgi:hypothetical protein